MADLNITFNHYGITAVLSESAVDTATLSTENNAGPFRQAVYTEMFNRLPEITYTDATDTETFTLGCGTITIPSEMITEGGFTVATAQAKLNEISDRLVAAYPA
jgi:hypothetical protein